MIETDGIPMQDSQDFAFCLFACLGAGRSFDMSVGEPCAGPPITELQLSLSDLRCMSPLPAFPVRTDRLFTHGFYNRE